MWLRLAFAGVVLSIAGALGGIRCQPGGNGEAVRMRLGLPAGSSEEQIAPYLTARGIGYRFVADEHRIYGITPEVSRGFLVSESLQLVITLDGDDRLETLHISPVYTGP